MKHGLIFAVLIKISELYPTEVKDVFHTFTAPHFHSSENFFKVKHFPVTEKEHGRQE